MGVKPKDSKIILTYIHLGKTVAEAQVYLSGSPLAKMSDDDLNDFLGVSVDELKDELFETIRGR